MSCFYAKQSQPHTKYFYRDSLIKMSKVIEQQLEKIHDELRGGEQDLSQGRPKSLKYHVRDIQQRFGEWLTLQGHEKDKRRYELTWSLCLVGVVGILLAITRSAGSDIEWISEHTLTFRVWAVVLCSVFVGVSLERSPVLGSLWGFSITKFLVSIILSGVVVYSRGKAAGLINGVFHVDAAALPITLIFTTALLVIKTLVPFILTVALVLSVVHALISFGWVKSKLDGDRVGQPPLYSVLSILVSLVILYFGLSWSSDQIADHRVPGKIYLMAHALDFNYSHECANVAENRPVVFLGNTQESVLVGPYKLPNFGFSDFFEASVDVPTNFVRQRCNYKPVLATHQWFQD